MKNDSQELPPHRSYNGYKSGTQAPTFNHLISDALISETKVFVWFCEGRIDDRVFDDRLWHLYIQTLIQSTSPIKILF